MRFFAINKQFLDFKKTVSDIQNIDAKTTKKSEILLKTAKVTSNPKTRFKKVTHYVSTSTLPKMMCYVQK